jgi:hypothetical protein
MQFPLLGSSYYLVHLEIHVGKHEIPLMLLPNKSAGPLESSKFKGGKEE